MPFLTTILFSLVNSPIAATSTSSQTCGVVVDFTVESGSQDYEVPDCVTVLYAIVVGGGGGAAGHSNDFGGGGGALSYGAFSVTSGDTLNLVVGDGGAGAGSGQCDSNGFDGGDSYISKDGVSLLKAGGGKKGLNYYYNITAAGGISSGTERDGGGDGGRGGYPRKNNTGGGGGGAGGYSGNGGNGYNGNVNLGGSSGSGGGGAGGQTDWNYCYGQQCFVLSKLGLFVTCLLFRIMISILFHSVEITIIFVKESHLSVTMSVI